jgi:hypothetical protein
VQWHPENILQTEPRMTLLFRRFVAAAAGGTDAGGTDAGGTDAGGTDAGDPTATPSGDAKSNGAAR